MIIVSQNSGLLAFLFLIVHLSIDHKLVFFKEENYLLAKNELVKKVRIKQIFFLILLIVYKKV